MRFPYLLLLFIATCCEAAEPMTTLVIAHRGASGYLPEHTLEAKAMAFAQGADYLEQDVVMTADDQLVVLHDLTLDRTTDVAERFPDRARADGHFYVIDFTLAELRELRVGEGVDRRSGRAEAVFPGRFPPGRARFGIHTLQEELDLVAGLAASTGRTVGIYPELKSPWFHHQHGKDLATAVLTVLRDHGYTTRGAPVFVQTFDHAELRRVHDELLPALGMDLRLVQLIAENAWEETFERTPDGSWRAYDYGWMRTPEGLRRLATLADGVGPAYDMLVDVDGGRATPNGFVAAAHAAGLAVHPYTFRRDGLPAYAASFEALLELFVGEVGVDGVFTDFPDLAVRFVQARR